jgi:hypothetical protein
MTFIGRIPGIVAVVYKCVVVLSVLCVIYVVKREVVSRSFGAVVSSFVSTSLIHPLIPKGDWEFDVVFVKSKKYSRPRS